MVAILENNHYIGDNALNQTIGCQPKRRSKLNKRFVLFETVMAYDLVHTLLFTLHVIHSSLDSDCSFSHEISLSFECFAIFQSFE